VENPVVTFPNKKGINTEMFINGMAARYLGKLGSAIRPIKDNSKMAIRGMCVPCAERLC